MSVDPIGEMTAIERHYTDRTPGSASMMARASESMPRGLTRTLSWFAPYPVVFHHGKGCRLTDVDGNSYVDLFSNGLSLMHGHAYPPIEEALARTLPRGTAWPGASDAQIEFAQLLVSRIAGADLVRFANTGTEATMLAVKLARHVTGREMIIKAWHAYHGSYSDLEAGLEGKGDQPGRASLADFGEIESYERLLAEYEGKVAAIIVEPVQYTGVVTPPPPGFLPKLRELARRSGVLFILDDCLMFRLGEGGSAERFEIEDPDITCLGKWIGGGLPVGAIAARAELMERFDLDPVDPLYHGGSFNGNVLGMVAGEIAVRELTAADIERIDAQGDALRADIDAYSGEVGLPARTSGVGSAFGLYALDGDGEIDHKATSLLHLAAVNRGVYYGSGGEVGLSTKLSDADLDEVREALRGAIEDVAELSPSPL